jgi:putative transposase
MLRQREENGIVKFMQKVGTGYTMYFNKKYKRAGSLFQGRFKAVHIDRNEQLIYLPHYIHTNPLTLNYGGSTFIDFLEKYRWSSFPDYVGIKNFPLITHRDYLLEVFGGELKYRLHTDDCLREFSREDIINKIKNMEVEPPYFL